MEMTACGVQGRNGLATRGRSGTRGKGLCHFAFGFRAAGSVLNASGFATNPLRTGLSHPIFAAAVASFAISSTALLNVG